jgi:hypothetical protein
MFMGSDALNVSAEPSCRSTEIRKIALRFADLVSAHCDFTDLSGRNSPSTATVPYGREVNPTVPRNSGRISSIDAS